MKVLIVGLGSIGKRYAKILLDMGHEVYGSDIDRKIVVKGVTQFAHWGDDHGLLDVVFICTPPSDHMVRALSWKDKHLFIEKPLATDLSDVEDVEKELSGDKVNMVSCNMRYDPLIKKAYEHLFIQESIGQILCVKTDFGYYLPDWRPGVDLKDVEVPGIALDNIHDIDLLMWMHGDPTDVKGNGATYDTAAGRVVGNINAVMVFGEVLANIHMDYYRREKKRTIEWIGTEGTITYVGNRSLKNPNEANYLSVNDKHHMDFYEHDEPYIEQVKDFFEAVKYGAVSPNPIDEAKDVLKVALEIQGNK